MIELEFPRLPPTINHYYGRRGHLTFLTQDGVAFRKVVSDIASANAGHFTEDDRIEVAMYFTFANKRRCDIDNRVKPLWDAIVKCGIIPDDKQVDVAHIYRCQGKTESTRIILDNVLDRKERNNDKPYYY